jgi:hypothetical protein
MTGVVLTSEVMSAEDGSLEYATVSHDAGDVEDYQCRDCGYVIEDSTGRIITDPEDLCDWLEDQEETRRRDDKNGLYPENDDVAN